MVTTDTNGEPTYVIFGATGGTGTALCHLLADRGSRLFLAGRDADRLQALASELNSPSMLVDAAVPEQFDQCLKAAEQEYGQLSGAANCMGSLLLKPAHRTTDEEWHATMLANLGSAFATVRAAARVMRKTGGSIVLVASAAAQTGLPNHEAIAAAKAGVIGLTRSAAASYASSGLRFNAVSPGLIRTKMTEGIWSNDTAAAGSIAMHPLGRLGEPRDVASAIAWLLDPANSWVTGQVIGVDGGLAHVRGRVKQ